MLLIDDDELFIFLTRQSFLKSDLIQSFDAVTNKLEAIAYLEDKKQNPSDFPDIILIDFNLQEVDGLTLAQYFQQHLKDQFPHSRIFMLTCSRDKQRISRALKVPVVEKVLQKPLSTDILESFLIS
jgi:CheY-like chemotaxis protein